MHSKDGCCHNCKNVWPELRSVTQHTNPVDNNIILSTYNNYYCVHVEVMYENDDIILHVIPNMYTIVYAECSDKVKGKRLELGDLLPPPHFYPPYPYNNTGYPSIIIL